jgi:hypothetical protein
MKTAAFYAGQESKAAEIQGMGFEAARDKFNAENPPGEKSNLSAEGKEFAAGEFYALCQNQGCA